MPDKLISYLRPQLLANYQMPQDPGPQEPGIREDVKTQAHFMTKAPHSLPSNQRPAPTHPRMCTQRDLEPAHLRQMLSTTSPNNHGTTLKSAISPFPQSLSLRGATRHSWLMRYSYSETVNMAV